MKTLKRMSLVFIILVFTLLVIPRPVFAQSDDGDTKVILGGTYVLESGQSLDRDLAIFGGQGTLEKDTEVNGDILIAGGTLIVDGEVNGNIVATGGTVYVEKNAEINGDIILAAATLEVDDEADISGNIVKSGDNLDFNISPSDFIPDIRIPTSGISNAFSAGTNFLFNLVWDFLKILALAGLAALVVLLLQKPTERVAESLILQPAVSGGLGLLTLIVAVPLIILLSITIILIPVALVAVLAWILAILYGWIAVSLEIGKRVARLLKQDWAAPIAGGIGALLLTLIVSMLDWIPCIGWVFWIVPASFGLGAVLASRFGTQVYGQAVSVEGRPAAPKEKEIFEASFTSAAEDEMDEDAIMKSIFEDEAEDEESNDFEEPLETEDK